MGGRRRRGEGGVLYLTATLSPPRMISAIKMGASDVSRLNVSFIVQGLKSRDCVHPSIAFFFLKKGEPKRGIEPASFRLPAERLNHQAKPAHSQESTSTMTLS